MLEIIPAYERTEEIKELFSEYTRMLVSLDSSFQLYLDIQHYDDEEKHPEVKYMEPDGRLYLAISDGHTAGCIALRKLDDEKGELKRLYVRPEYRGKGIAKMLTDKIISMPVVSATNGYTSIPFQNWKLPLSSMRNSVSRKQNAITTAHLKKHYSSGKNSVNTPSTACPLIASA